MATVLRVTRHSDMSAAQMEALQDAATKLTGEATSHDVVIHGQTVTGAQQVLDLAREHGASVVEAVLPPAILADLTNPRVNPEGIPVIRAVMSRIPDPKPDNPNNVRFVFDENAHYERIVRVTVETERL